MFYFDIWDEGDQPRLSGKALDLGGGAGGVATAVDVFVTTYDEPIEVVRPSLKAVAELCVPKDVRVRLCLLDDGGRAEMAREAERCGASYFARQSGEGFKAGNLRHALLRTSAILL